MDKYTDNKPNAAKLLESLRSTGYDNYSAIADLIDNSFDANADQVKVTIGENGKDSFVLSIADNGDGMDEKTLDQALRLGSLTNQDEERLGKYGMGLITASISIGRRLIVITKREGVFLTGIHDLDDVANRNEFVKEVRRSTDAEANLLVEALGAVVSGTVILIQKVDNLHTHNLTQFVSKLMKECGEVFRDFLRANKTLMINRKLVLAVDPMMRNDSETDEFLDRTQEFVDEKGDASTIRLRIYNLPKFSIPDAKDKKVNQTNQGFYLMRNNRQIARGENLGIFSKHNDFNRFRAEVYFSGSLDRKVGVNFKKQGISLSDDIRSWIELIAHPQLDTIRDIAKKEQARDKNAVDHTATERNITSRSTVLKKPRIDEETAAPDVKSLSNESFANAKFEVDHNTHLAPLFQVRMKGDKLTIHYNADHVFYDSVVSAHADNKDLVNAIDSLVYSASLALIEITSSEKLIHLKDKFLDDMSDNLRTLLS